MLKRLKFNITQHIRQNLVLYLVIIFALLTGLASGSFTSGAMDDSQKVGLNTYLENFFSYISERNIKKNSIFLESIWQNFKFALLVWVSGLFFFGIPLTFIFVGIRSFFMGFTVGFLVSQYKIGGFLFTLICILPQNIIYIPCIIGIGVLAMEHSKNLFKNRKLSFSREQRLKKMAPYTTRIIILFLIMIVGSVFEAYITPLFFNMFKWAFK